MKAEYICSLCKAGRDSEMWEYWRWSYVQVLRWAYSIWTSMQDSYFSHLCVKMGLSKQRVSLGVGRAEEGKQWSDRTGKSQQAGTLLTPTTPCWHLISTAARGGCHPHLHPQGVVQNPGCGTIYVWAELRCRSASITFNLFKPRRDKRKGRRWQSS